MCHNYLAATADISDGLWLHAPAAQGDCAVCHNPHESTNPFLLNKKPEQVCSQCHTEDLLMEIQDHQKSEDCISCHNPHLGKNQNMLKKDFKEMKHPVEPWPPD